MIFDLGRPEKFSFHLWLVTNTWFRVWFRLWYKNITIQGKHNLNKKYPIILAPNHQNSAMDALILVGTQHRQIVWLARADIFKNKILREILKFIKILPIYRMQDGAQSLVNNNEVFKKSVEILEEKKILAIFPEATHWGFRRLRATKKAIPRIAFMAEEAHNFELNTHVVPVGINYEDYTGMRSNILINIGEPISVKDFMGLYKNNPQQAHLELKNKIELGIKKLIIHIPYENQRYEAYDYLRKICQNTTSKHFSYRGNRFNVAFTSQRKVIDILEQAKEKTLDDFEKLLDETTQYINALSKQEYQDCIVEQNGGDAFQIMWNILKIIVGLPIFIIGFLFHFATYYSMNKASKKFTNDKQFYNSISFGVSFILVPFSYLLFGLVYLQISPLPFWSVFILFIFLIITWVLSIEYYKVFIKTSTMLRFNWNLLLENKSEKELVGRRRKIIKMFSTLLQKHKN